jgi:soluble lytic murein transglycosylase-like protein
MKLRTIFRRIMSMLKGLYNVIDRITGLQRKFGNIQNKYSQSLNQLNTNISKNQSSEATETSSNKNFEEVLTETNKESTVIKDTSNKDINHIIKEKAEKYNLSEELISSIIKVESNYNPNAVSNKGAKGLMQLMPSTAMELGVNNIFDVEENIEGGSKYLRQLLNKYNGDIKTALAAYNSGMGNVQKYNGIPPYGETNKYITKVLNNLSGADEV